MPENLTFDETRYLAALITGEFKPDYWNNGARARLADKLNNMGQSANRLEQASAYR